ncbi:malate/lactate/ureidoglycolate dehydrogenase [Hyphobacterium marinum]|uniref:Malate/lactate/ureidoglycolate dehydrogenase n=1 Tax=Hyphobacterium marinum TaxID=3116574 RepID=A0ABU7LX91_9PROT|nr:malate/lactate/ureidoglycolate dehydrogenase [Hyphobacterium sp. Y6023]MEE2566173.1 malate/lactate/ureidoglycolate dehydrogenase [Hyphobacterium sp. Y6023]
MDSHDVRIPSETLSAFCRDALIAAGARDGDARKVAAQLVEANLAGHDSHGAGLLPAYVKHAKGGLVDLAAEPDLTDDTGAILKIDAKGGWGRPSGDFAMAKGAARAEVQGSAIVALANAHHLGRIGAYGELAAQAGLISIHFVNVTDHDPMVAPYRGSDARFGTNPVCIAFPPTPERAMFLLDMATSRIALGKARVAANRGDRVAFGAIIDENGMPTDDPSGFKGFELKGALAPLGDHKGYGLAFAAELLAGVLTGGGTIQPANERRGGIRNHMLSILLKPDAFGDPDAMEAEMDAMMAYALASPPADWDSPVLMPGDPERALRAKRAQTGIPFDPVTLGELNKAAEGLGLKDRLG